MKRRERDLVKSSRIEKGGLLFSDKQKEQHSKQVLLIYSHINQMKKKRKRWG
jgi:hypothetical protein